MEFLVEKYRFFLLKFCFFLENSVLPLAPPRAADFLLRSSALCHVPLTSEAPLCAYWCRYYRPFNLIMVAKSVNYRHKN